MSNSPTGPTSTTGSSSNSSSRPDRGAAAPASPAAAPASLTANISQAARPTAGATSAVAVIACGALGGHVREIAARRGWDVRVHSLPAMLHNTPARIGPAAERLAADLQRTGYRVALAYADCGTYGELDEVCSRLGLARLPGLHCYDVLAGPDRIRAALDAEPGTYLLTDYLVRSFRRSVIEPLGLDRYPELWTDYFGHYQRVVWLAQSRSAELEAEAERIAALFGLPLTVLETGTTALERELERLVTPSATSVTPAPAAPTPTPSSLCVEDCAGYSPHNPPRSWEPRAESGAGT